MRASLTRVSQLYLSCCNDRKRWDERSRTFCHPRRLTATMVTSDLLILSHQLPAPKHLPTCSSTLFQPVHASVIRRRWRLPLMSGRAKQAVARQRRTRGLAPGMWELGRMKSSRLPAQSDQARKRCRIGLEAEMTFVSCCPGPQIPSSCHGPSWACPLPSWISRLAPISWAAVLEGQRATTRACKC